MEKFRNENYHGPSKLKSKFFHINCRGMLSMKSEELRTMEKVFLRFSDYDLQILRVCWG